MPKRKSREKETGDDNRDFFLIKVTRPDECEDICDELLFFDFVESLHMSSGDWKFELIKDPRDIIMNGG